MRKFKFSMMLVCGWFLVVPVNGQVTKKAQPVPDFSAEMAKIPPKSPEESLRSIKLKPGFHAELVASEPLIRSPMAMDFDEFGRAYVVELPEYNQYASPKPHGKGAIKRLEDSDGDGKYDKATVYVDNLDYPTAVACWNGGVLIGVAPDLIYCKDTNGDGKADVQVKLFTGFGQDKGGEGMLNSFHWRIDNRFQIPTGLDGGEIVGVGKPAGAGTKSINVRGQHLWLEPRGMTIVATSGGGQHGMSLDDWNLRGFTCGNSDPAFLNMYDARYLARNPYLAAPVASVNIAPEGKYTKLMRVSKIEPWRIIRTRLRKQGLIPGSDEGGEPSGFFTGATGITVYRGDAWPKEYRGNLFVGEVANNLVYRAKTETNGIGFTARRADTEAEFLASSDNWFRPVQFANAPDGTLYVIDMYRELIEGAAFLAPQILKHLDTAAGANAGRIYRIAPDGFRAKVPPRLGDLSTIELVKFYEHANAWHRETASRLIYERQDKTAVEALKTLAAKSASPLARVMAIYSLQGLSALDKSMVIEALKAKESEVREHALILSESFPKADMRDAVVRLASDPEIRVRYQAAFTLGAFSGPSVNQALKQLAETEGSNPWIQLAVLSSIGNQRADFLGALLNDPRSRELAHVRSMIMSVASQIGSANVPSELAAFLKSVDSLPASEQSMATDLMKTLVAVRPSLRGGGGERTRAILTTLLRDAAKVAGNDSSPPAQRVVAIRTLASGNFAEVS